MCYCQKPALRAFQVKCVFCGLSGDEQGPACENHVTKSARACSYFSVIREGEGESRSVHAQCLFCSMRADEQCPACETSVTTSVTQKVHAKRIRKSSICACSGHRVARNRLDVRLEDGGWPRSLREQDGRRRGQLFHIKNVEENA